MRSPVAKKLLAFQQEPLCAKRGQNRRKISNRYRRLRTRKDSKSNFECRISFLILPNTPSEYECPDLHLRTESVRTHTAIGSAKMKISDPDASGTNIFRRVKPNYSCDERYRRSIGKKISAYFIPRKAYEIALKRQKRMMIRLIDAAFKRRFNVDVSNFEKSSVECGAKWNIRFGSSSIFWPKISNDFRWTLQSVNRRY